MNRLGEVWAMGDDLFVCLGDDPKDPARYEFQAFGSERKVRILKTGIDYIAEFQGPTRWWRKLS